MPEPTCHGDVFVLAIGDALLAGAVARAAELTPLRGAVLGLVKQAQYAAVYALLGTGRELRVNAAI
jgi:hypothetical protein